MIVEALINLKDFTKEKAFDSGDIITIQPENFNWGKGDLKGRIVVQIDMPEFPCKRDFMIKKRCSQCEYQGIDWQSVSLTDGDIGSPKLICPKEQYTSPDADFVFNIDFKGTPGVQVDLKAKRRAKLKVDDVLTLEDKNKYLAETDLTEEEKDAKLAKTRNLKNLITVDKIEIK